MRAVLERDYLFLARQPRSFVTRGVIGSLACLVLAFFAASLGGTPDRVGKEVFETLRKMLFLFTAIVTPTLLVGTILTERTQRTLPILLASPVTPLGLAAGKFLSRTGTVLGWMAAALPPLTVALLYGGVSARDIANTVFGLLGVVLELGAWALLVSAVGRRLATAGVLVYLLPALHWGAVADIALVPAPSTPLHHLAAAATSPLPFLGGTAAWPSDRIRAGFPGAFGWILSQPGLAFFLGAALFAAAAVVLSGRLLAREDEVRTRESLRLPRPRMESNWRERLVRGNPIAWKESLLLNTAASRTLYYAAGGLLLLGEAAFLVLHAREAWNPADNLLLFAASGTLLMTLAAVTGAASMAHEKGQGSLELLRLTRLTPAEIASGKLGGLLVGIGWLAVIPLGHLAISVVAGYLHPVSAILAAGALAAGITSYAVQGLHWGTLAPAPWLALAGALALPVIGFAGCGLCFLVPIALTVFHMTRGTVRLFVSAIGIPAFLTGPPLLLLGALPLAVQSIGQPFTSVGSLAGFGSGGVGGFGFLGFLSLLVHLAYIHHRRRELPSLLRREMARISEGEGDERDLLRGYRVVPPPARVPPPPPAAGEVPR